MGRPRRGARRPRRRLWLISPEGFRELRHSCLLSQRQAAAYLGVCLRTVRHWDSGRNRVPWSVVRLLRLLRAGELGGLCDEWAGWTVNRLGLHAPDGRTFRVRDMRHWWLTIEQAHLFREGYERATMPSAAQPRERLEGASTFPREEVGQGEKRTRETVQNATPSAAPFSGKPALEALEASDPTGVLPGKCSALPRQDAQSEQLHHFSHLPAVPSVGGFGSVECVHSAGANLSAPQPAPLDQRSWYVPTFNKGLKANIWWHTGGILPPVPISSRPPATATEDSL